jgi:hypothetical protein
MLLGGDVGTTVRRRFVSSVRRCRRRAPVWYDFRTEALLCIAMPLTSEQEDDDQAPEEIREDQCDPGGSETATLPIAITTGKTIYLPLATH